MPLDHRGVKRNLEILFNQFKGQRGIAPSVNGGRTDGWSTPAPSTGRQHRAAAPRGARQASVPRDGRRASRRASTPHADHPRRVAARNNRAAARNKKPSRLSDSVSSSTGAAYRIRTCDVLIRSQTLYPAEVTPQREVYNATNDAVRQEKCAEFFKIMSGSTFPLLNRHA